ncbi:trypsin epsilon-like [Drosophila eugracilis]|uniref:trypsin epsilon-like n=1 Tax=Drosophila eugracilis TaxID=29029 RepID=UPI001BDB6703|nr:trypsin epsilon-like [Drosophila eugracilis]
MCRLVSLVLIVLAFCHRGDSQLLEDDCFEPSSLDFRITGGQRAIVNAPFMVGLYNGTELQCGGTLINKKYVLTAAHCIRDYIITVRLGSNYRFCSPVICPYVQHRNVESILHPSFNSKDSAYSDIALLKLDKEVTFNANIKPICIVLDEDVNSDGVNKFLAYGWGNTKQQNSTSYLKFVDLERLPAEDCYGTRIGQICAGSPLGDTCWGDSGGPLVSNFKYRGRQLLVQFGIISFGNEDCDGNGIYTDVNENKIWIANTVLESEPRLLTEQCGSDWGSNVLVRLWEMALFQTNFSGALITNQFVLTVASAIPAKVTEIKVESISLKVYDVEWFRKHPGFTDSPSIRNNIAVIKLARKMEPSYLYKPICLGINLSASKLRSVYLYSPNSEFLGYQNIILKRINDCFSRTNKRVERNQLCIETPDKSKYAAL